MRSRTALTAVGCAVVVLACAALPLTLAQAFAAAGAGGAQAVAGAGLPVATPAPMAACVNMATISPWGQPALIFGGPPGLLTPDNRTYSDVTLCCGGTASFDWTQAHGVWQLATRACPTAFVNSPSAGQQLLQTITPVGSKTLRFPQLGTYYITSQSGNDCAAGMLLAINVVGTCPPAAPAPGSQAAASGSPGCSSTSTAPGAAAAASGPPGTSFTSTAPGQSFSASGGRRRLQLAMF